ncbi:hypothetical protein STCU_08779 [Strigomonas culicis]|uniref:RING-type domain-containing protein n=1 Tax=Strigomonas culicis TaxID=28005 RepID=S9VCT9_9TRYP|nr:hypothetical protein STCU_08779 [Strigomonas culicis]|eukprot:EPY20910.1 hypothetical protein STCU_08779 [Strigomonas culicis]
MSKYFKPDSTFGADAECAICCCMWIDPVEITNCDHIFCRNCLRGVTTCPTCCRAIAEVRPPNQAIIRMPLRAHGSCSVCPWTGSYKEYNEKHTTCEGGGPVPSSLLPPVLEPTKEEELALQDYYLEESTTSQAAYSVFVDAPSVSTAALSLTNPRSLKDSYSSATPSMQSGSKADWKKSLDICARDFGLGEEEFNDVVDLYYDFSTATVQGEPRLRWRDACRLLRYSNYPNHPYDVQSLFDSVHEPPSSGSVTLMALLLWIPLNSRNPVQWYAMPPAAYTHILKVAQLFDTERTGLFTLDQAHMLAEEYFERDVPQSEWRMIKEYIKDKDVTIRQALILSVNKSTVAESNLKVPFHDILTSFRLYVLRRKQKARNAAKTVPPKTEPRGEVLIRRIRNLVRHYEPSGLSRLEATLQNFRGEEESLLMTMVAMYGPEPPLQR